MTDAARFFQALGDETRLALLEQLRDGEKTVGALVEALGCPQPKVSRHLKVLKKAGLVRDRKDGRHVAYELATTARWAKEPRRWIELLDAGLVPAELMVPAPNRAEPEPDPGPASLRRDPSRGAAPPRETPARTDDLETYLL